jgi:hypothetical protein
MAQASCCDRTGGEDGADRLLTDQGGGGEDQTRLHEAGEGLGLAMPEAVLGVGRRLVA